MKSKAVLLVIALFAAGAAFAEQASRASVVELMELTGSKDIGQQMLAQMIPAMKRMAPEAPESFWTEVNAEANFDDLMDQMVPIYQKYLTQEDVDQAIVFYSSATGRKIADAQPMIAQEAMQVGQVWGQQIVQRAIQKLQATAQ